MSNKDGQMELPRKAGKAREVKKKRTRRKRAEAKKIDEDGLHPLHNRYHGYD